MIRVLHLINYPGQGGTEKYIMTLAENLHNKNCQFFLGYSMEGSLLQEIQQLKVRTFNIPMMNCFDIKAAFRLKKICKNNYIDVVHTHFLRENCISVLSKIIGNKVKLINTRHMAYENPKTVRCVNRILSRSVQESIAVSNAVKVLMLNEGIAENKISVIYNGVDLKYWKLREHSNIRDKFNIGSEDFLVTCVARFTNEKGHVFLFDSIQEFNMREKLKPNAKIVKFLLVGDGELLEGFREKVKNNPDFHNVLFTGYRKDVKNILHESNLLVSPSESEAFGISIIEALASGIPVIATNVGGQKEILERCECGLLVDFNNTHSFVDALERFVNDESFYNRVISNALITVKERFSAEHMALRTYEIYAQ